MEEPLAEENILDDSLSTVMEEPQTDETTSVDDPAPIDESIAAPRYNLRPDRQRSYNHRFDHQMDQASNANSYDAGTTLLHQHKITRVITGLVMTQMSAIAGIKKFGQPAIDALTKEFKQLHEKNVFSPQHPRSLSREQKRAALRAVNLIKEKRTGDLKGRTCADGSVQRGLYNKEDTSSPTLSNDSLMCTLIVDAKERRDVATADVVGAYLNALMKDFVLLKLVGEAVDIMIGVDSVYKKFVTIENGKKVLYLKLEKALYGCVQSALLWYELFSGTLLDLGFELNQYDACVANKMIEGTQCTVAWYVDDTKISHVKPDVVTNIIEHIESKFGKMTVTRGKEHTFLGMDIKFNDNETVTISMNKHLEEAISTSGIVVTKTATTPAQKNFFEVETTSMPLSKENSELFHSTVAKLLYISLRARPDLLLATSFLCTRVSRPTEQDHRKLQRVLEYIHGTMNLTLTIGADRLDHIRTWVDASYATHEDMKSHTGGIISFGTGGLFCKSSKQKLNTKSSTEAELVGASDYLVNIIWLKMFLEAQGIPVTSNILKQDNQSAIRLETNGKASAGKQSRHIDIRYFFIKDRVQQERITIHHCNTENMIADFFTKPLQGALFLRFRDVILGYSHTVSLASSTPTESEERVEECVRTVEEVNDTSDAVRASGTVDSTVNSDSTYEGRSISSGYRCY